MENRSEDVEAFIEELDHPLKTSIAHVRNAILASNDQIAERIKWNAPSFCFAGDDRVTFRLHPKARFQLIFHRGARKKSTGFSFDDSSGLMSWAAPDRGIVMLDQLGTDEIEARTGAIVRLVNEWVHATSCALH